MAQSLAARQGKENDRKGSDQTRARCRTPLPSIVFGKGIEDDDEDEDEEDEGEDGMESIVVRRLSGATPWVARPKCGADRSAGSVAARR